MNPLGFLAILIALVYAWVLIHSLRQGEFRFKSTSTTTGGTGGRARVRREDSPKVFWVLVAFHSALIAYIASFAFIE
jgi:hypothetical protein